MNKLIAHVESDDLDALEEELEIERIEPKQLNEALRNYRGRVKIEGVDSSGRKGFYTFYLR